MRTLYIDCGMGAAGDMLTAALLELFENKEEIVKQLNALQIPHVTYTLEPSTKCGITGTHIRVEVDGIEEDEHLHAHHHHHTHSSMHQIEHVLEHMSLDESIKTDVLNVYQIIAEAESKVHGVPVSEIHFHEVGSLDAIADVTAVCYLIKQLHVDQILASPIHVGSGTVKCAHGILPVPAPATALILQDVPIYSADIQSELCTPTGAALLKYYVNQFISMPVLKVEKIGYGMGKKDFPRANCVRVLLAQSMSDTNRIVELNANVDDMTAEEIGFATEALFSCGATEVFVTPIYMKKNRPGHMITVMCKEELKDQIVQAVFKYTSTIGIRMNIEDRFILNRRIETIDTPLGNVRKKYVEGYGVSRWKYEFDDLNRIAKENHISLKEVIEKIEAKK